jgi:hypothetical protein
MDFFSCSCLIARNLLGGMKTCSDIFQYMKYTDNSSASGDLNGLDSLADGHIEVGFNVLFYFYFILAPGGI